MVLADKQSVVIGNGTTTGTLQMSGVFDRSLAATATADRERLRFPLQPAAVVLLLTRLL